MNLCILQRHLQHALQRLSCPQSNIHGWAGLIMAHPMINLMMTTPFRVPNNPGPLAIDYPPPVEILDTDGAPVLNAWGQPTIVVSTPMGCAEQATINACIDPKNCHWSKISPQSFAAAHQCHPPPYRMWKFALSWQRIIVGLSSCIDQSLSSLEWHWCISVEEKRYCCHLFIEIWCLHSVQMNPMHHSWSCCEVHWCIPVEENIFSCHLFIEVWCLHWVQVVPSSIPRRDLLSPEFNGLFVPSKCFNSF
jgi:hypothetical protein